MPGDDEINKVSEDERESLLSMIASEEVLKKEWDNEADKRWDNHSINSPK